MAKIYTKTGDDGTTSLFDGTRVSKNDARIDTYGDIDELNSLLGVVVAHLSNQKDIQTLLLGIQRDLFALGAQLANPSHKKQKDKSQFSEEKVTKLENAIDQLEKEIDPIKSFILPGGSVAAAYLDYARTVCRRGERKMVSLLKGDPESLIFIRYVNRLSDLLFIIARVVNKRSKIKDIPWT